MTFELVVKVIFLIVAVLMAAACIGADDDAVGERTGWMAFIFAAALVVMQICS